MSKASNPAPGFRKYPGHRLAAAPAKERVRVIFNGEAIADTQDAVALTEDTGEGKKTVAPVVYYIPRKDVKMERLERTAHSTHCPFKGDAAYFSLKNGPENAVWSYEQPYDEMMLLKDRLAFYPDKVDAISVTAA